MVIKATCRWLCSPLDELIDKLGGPEHVAEMTGRRWRVVRPSSSDAPSLQLRDSSLDAAISSNNLDTLNVREVQRLSALYRNILSLSLHSGVQSSIFLCLSQARINWEGCGRKGIQRKTGANDGGGLLIGPDGVAPTRIVGVSASCYPP